MEEQPEVNQSQTPEDIQVPVESSAPQEPKRRERRNKKRMMLFAAGGAILVLLLAGGVYWFLLRPEPKQPAAQQTGDTNTEETSDTVAPVQQDSTPETFKSEALNIELTHRGDWTAKEADGEVRVTSPEVSFTTSTDQAQSGVFTLIVRKDVPEAMKTTINKAVASRASKVIGYTAPTEEQRQYTNVSYGGTNKDTFNFFIVTGSAEFKVGSPFQYALPLDGEYYLIVGGFGAPDSSLSYDAAKTTMIDDETTQQALAIVESLKIF